MEQAAAERVSGQAVVDTGRAVYIALHGAAAIRRRGGMHYNPVERNLKPTGVEVMDHYLRRLTEGKDEVTAFCKIYGLRTEDLENWL